MESGCMRFWRKEFRDPSQLLSKKERDLIVPYHQAPPSASQNRHAKPRRLARRLCLIWGLLKLGGFDGSAEAFVWSQKQL